MIIMKKQSKCIPRIKIVAITDCQSLTMPIIPEPQCLKKGISSTERFRSSRRNGLNGIRNFHSIKRIISIVTTIVFPKMAVVFTHDDNDVSVSGLAGIKQYIIHERSSLITDTDHRFRFRKRFLL